jgi:hypothetical protein
LIERSLAHPTRTVRVDQALLEEISELTGIEYRVLSSAFAGEEKNLKKLGVHSQLQALVFAARHGVVEIP